MLEDEILSDYTVSGSYFITCFTTRRLAFSYKLTPDTAISRCTMFSNGAIIVVLNNCHEVRTAGGNSEEQERR